MNQTLVFTDVTGTPAVGGGLGIAAVVAPAFNTATDLFPNGTGSTPLDTTPNTEGWWNLRIINVSTGAPIESRYLNFNENGALNSTRDSDDELKIPLTGINFGNGSAFQDIDIQVDAFSQFAGDFNVAFTDQNGAELGLRTGVEINREGIVSARFSNGQSTDLYQIPLSTFSAQNELTEVSGNAYTETGDSGSFNLRIAGQGGAGLIEGAALEGSNVDLAEEFSQLIITQRAYSAGTRLISTADEITEELLRIL